MVNELQIFIEDLMYILHAAELHEETPQETLDRIYRLCKETEDEE